MFADDCTLSVIDNNIESVVYNGVRIWNEIPENIRGCNTMDSFKFRYKNHVVEQYDSSHE